MEAGQGLRYARLARTLPEIKAEGLTYVELITDPSNIESQRVIQANGGVLVERFVEPAQYGNAEGLRFRIELR